MLGVKVTLFFILIGFAAGAIANFAAVPVMTFITQSLPQLLTMGWFISGIAGSVLTISLVTMWNWMMSRRQQ